MVLTHCRFEIGVVVVKGDDSKGHCRFEIGVAVVRGDGGKGLCRFEVGLAVDCGKVDYRCEANIFYCLW